MGENMVRKSGRVKQDIRMGSANEEEWLGALDDCFMMWTKGREEEIETGIELVGQERERERERQRFRP